MNRPIDYHLFPYDAFRTGNNSFWTRDFASFNPDGFRINEPDPIRTGSAVYYASFKIYWLHGPGVVINLRDSV
jgi:hypothetical protein